MSTFETTLQVPPFRQGWIHIAALIDRKWHHNIGLQRNALHLVHRTPASLVWVQWYCGSLCWQAESRTSVPAHWTPLITIARLVASPKKAVVAPDMDCELWPWFILVLYLQSQTLAVCKLPLHQCCSTDHHRQCPSLHLYILPHVLQSQGQSLETVTLASEHCPCKLS